MSKGLAQVMYLAAPRQLEFRAEPLRALDPGELLCETIVTAISPGTELAAFTGMPPLRPGKAYPRLQGYCNVARVLESADERFADGDRVLSFTSHRSHSVLRADDVLFKLPGDANADHIACTYLYHLGYNAVLRGGVRAGSSVVIIGLGALGLASVAMAAIAGAQVFAISDQPRSAELAREMGAQGIFARRAFTELSSALPPSGADVVITTTGGWTDWQAALRVAGTNGVIAVLGFPGRGEPLPTENPLASEFFYQKQLRIEAVGLSPAANDDRGFLRFNERANIAWLAGLIMDGRLDPTLLISGRYPGSELGRAYEDLLSRNGAPVTFLLDWQMR